MVGWDDPVDGPISSRKSKSLLEFLVVDVCSKLLTGAVGGGTTDCSEGDDRPALGGPAIFKPPGGGGKRPGVPPVVALGRGLDAVCSLPDFLVYKEILQNLSCIINKKIQ